MCIRIPVTKFLDTSDQDNCFGDKILEWICSNGNYNITFFSSNRGPNLIGCGSVQAAQLYCGVPPLIQPLEERSEIRTEKQHPRIKTDTIHPDNETWFIDHDLHGVLDTDGVLSSVEVVLHWRKCQPMYMFCLLRNVDLLNVKCNTMYIKLLW